jgi:hypothetical protein
VLVLCADTFLIYREFLTGGDFLMRGKFPTPNILLKLQADLKINHK